jgi:hypothetical protein
VAKKGGVIRKYAEGGVVGAEMSQFNIGSAGALATPLGAEGLSDSLIQLVDIVQGIKETVDQETGDRAREKALGGDTGEAGNTATGGDVSQEITNNVSVTINIAKDGTASSETDTSTEGEDDDDKGAEDEERNEQFAELMQGVVLQTIVEEQRPGGLLWKK